MVSGPLNVKLYTFRSPEFANVVHDALEFLINVPVQPLTPLDGFAGAGVYALYYTGEFETYDYIAALNKEEYAQPIYVGKAVPPGWRTARTLGDQSTRALHGRLREHARSIEQAKNLVIDNFSCRFIILQGIETDLVTAVEAQIIRRYTPLWNTMVDGFGNHDPGKGRYNQARSEWDVLHPGRPWADRLLGASPRLQDIVNKIQQHKQQLQFS